MRPILFEQYRTDLGHLAHHMSTLMHRVFQLGFTPDGQPTEWTPAVDICETPEHYEVIVELAGVRREAIEVYTERHYLVLSGWRGDPMPRKKVRLYQMEIAQGHFHRRLQLPADADEKTVAAKCREGLLYITISKRPKAAP